MKTSGLPSIIFLGECSASSIQTICNIFANVFQNVCLSSNSGAPAAVNWFSEILDLTFVSLTYVDVFTALLAFYTNKGPGTDNIHTLVKKKLADTYF